MRKFVVFYYLFIFSLFFITLLFTIPTFNTATAAEGSTCNPTAPLNTCYDGPDPAHNLKCLPDVPSAKKGSSDAKKGHCGYNNPTAGPGGKGDPCNSKLSGQCSPDLFCQDLANTGTGKCTMAGEPGALCDVPYKACNAGLECRSDVAGLPKTCLESIKKIVLDGDCDPKFPHCDDGLECRQKGNDPKQNSCQKPDDSEPTPPPPPLPPCSEWTKDNKLCLSFDTAFGNIATNPGQFISTIFGIILSAAGAIALLLIIRAGYKIMTSEGKPEGIKEGRDQLIAAIVGLLFLIFSFVFLQAIGVDILQVPGFGSAGSVPSGGQCDASSSKDCAPGLTCKSVGGGKGGSCQ